MKAKTIYLFLSIFLLLSGCSDTRKPAEVKKPNVILIMIDDLNDYLGSFGGHPQALTPHMDKLADDGVRFTNAHTNVGLCNPSRNSLFTGVYPHHSGNFGFDVPTSKRLHENNKTLMEKFSENGYYVMGSGKLLHRNNLELWDEWGVKVNNYGPFAFNGDEQVGHPSVPQPFRSIGDVDGSYAPLSDVPEFPETEIKGKHVGWAYSQNGKEYFQYKNENDRDLLPDELHAQWAAKRLKEMDAEEFDRPFFMGVGFVRPHTPLYAPKRFFDMFPLDGIQIPALKEGDVEDTYYRKNYPVVRIDNGKWYSNTSKGRMYSQLLTESYDGDEEEGLKHFIQAYLACVAFVDEQVGVVLDALENSKFQNNTTIVLASDHGWQMGQKEYLFKNSPWDNSTRIPLVIRAPGKVGGGDVDHPVSLIDIFPTLVELCRLGGENKKSDMGYPVGGFSLLPFLEDPATDKWEGPEGALTAIAIDEIREDLNTHSFTYRTRNQRYILYPDGSEEFYDHTNDPYEWNNLALDDHYLSAKENLKKGMHGIIYKDER